MKLSRSIEYAVHGLLYIASNNGNENLLLSEIAEKQSVPESYMRKIFQTLARNGIVDAQRGVKGGYTLSRKAKAITLKEIVEAIDGHPKLYNCLSDQRDCELDRNCYLNRHLQKLENSIYDYLEQITLQNILDGLELDNFDVTTFKKKK
jgi:Rrf2 family protein